MSVSPTIAALVPGKSGGFTVIRDGRLLVAISASRDGGWHEGGDLLPGRIRAILQFASEVYTPTALVWRTTPPAPTTAQAQATIEAEAHAWRLAVRSVNLPVVSTEVDRGHREPLSTVLLGRVGGLTADERARLSLAVRLASDYAAELAASVEAELSVLEGVC